MTTVLITGANRGIGLELAKRYAAAGNDVLACCRDPASAKALNTLAAANKSVRVLGVHVADGKSVAALKATLGEQPIDVLINNAGMQGPPPQQRFTVSFYLTAMLFIVFDIEIVFLYPVAVVLDQVGWFAVAEFGFFIGILVLAYVYIWRKGALEWR